MQASKQFESGVREIDGLEVVGEPAMSVVAFKAAKGGPDIYKVNDLMGRKGWHLSPLQHPPALHMCFTAQHVHTIDALLHVSTLFVQTMLACLHLLSHLVWLCMARCRLVCITTCRGVGRPVICFRLQTPLMLFSIYKCSPDPSAAAEKSC